MRMSVCVMADIDEIGFFPHAESLGYDSVWVTDSQMLFSDCYAVLALAARQTSRLRLGPGVAICGTRIPPVHVAAMATLNRLAPGRVHLGIGTGNTAMRSMGQRADAHRRLRGVPARAARPAPGRRGGLRLRRRAPPDQDADPREEVHEPRAAHPALRLRLRPARHGAGRPVRRRPRLRDPAARRGRRPRRSRRRRPGPRRDGRVLGEDFHNCALTNIVLLEPGEAADSERVIRAVGPNVMASVYYFYDAVHERGIEPPPFLRRIWKRYCALVEETPAEHRHFRTHEGHYTYLHPGEAELIDADLVRDTCLVGTAEELIERIQELERGGLRELMLATGTDEKWRFSQQLADRVMARL